MRKIRVRNVSENFQELLQPSDLINKRSSINMDNHIGEYHYILIDKLKPYSKQARKIFDEDELKNLSQTILEYGVRQPLTVLKTEHQGVYEVLSGERRLKAAQIAGLDKVPCIILQTEKNNEEIALIENLQRVDLHPIEFSEACASLLCNKNFDQAQLAIKLGIHKSKISEAILFSKLPKKIKEYLIVNNIFSRSVLRKLVKLRSEVEMNEFLGIVAKNTDMLPQFIKLSVVNNDVVVKMRIDGISQEIQRKIVSDLNSIISKIS